MYKVFSNAVPTPTKKPPRYDLRHRKKVKKDTPETEPKEDIDSSFLDSAYLFNYDIEGSIYEEDNDEEIIADPSKISYDKNKLVKVAFNSNDWVFTQATAVASVNVKEDKHQITKDTLKFINSNNNCWTTETLRQTYKTFIGAKNLKDHIDTSDGGKIYGIIIDATPRRIKTVGKNYVLYIDCLIATNRYVDRDWADAIEKGKIKLLSVGYVCEFLQCSKCGHIYKTCGDGVCEHCAFELGYKYYDKDGDKSKVAAICLNIDNKSYFDELSYLSVDPAFSGAAQSYLLKAEPNTDIVVKMPYETLNKEAMVEFKKLNQYRILDKEVKSKVYAQQDLTILPDEIEQFLKINRSKVKFNIQNNTLVILTKNSSILYEIVDLCNELKLFYGYKTNYIEIEL